MIEVKSWLTIHDGLSLQMQMAIEANKNIVLFDGVCNLCNGLVQFIIKRDGQDKFRFAALQSDTGRQLLQEVGLIQNGMDSFVFIKDGTYLLRSTAALNL